MLIWPVTAFLYVICCLTPMVKKIGATVHKPAALADFLNEKEGDDDDDDGDDSDYDARGIGGVPMIEGFPIDCGTKDRKFLSMAKCAAVAATRHPHRVVVVMPEPANKAAKDDGGESDDGDVDGDEDKGGGSGGTCGLPAEFVKPFELWEDVGQHNVECGPLVDCCGDCLPEGVLSRPEGVMARWARRATERAKPFFLCTLIQHAAASPALTVAFEM